MRRGEQEESGDASEATSTPRMRPVTRGAAVGLCLVCSSARLMVCEGRLARGGRGGGGWGMGVRLHGVTGGGGLSCRWWRRQGGGSEVTVLRWRV